MNHVHRRVVFFLIIFQTQLLAQETFTLSGTVRDASTNESLIAANVRVDGTARGTITNASGQYRLPLAAGSYRIVVSYIGYASDTLAVNVRGDAVRHIRLEPALILLPEVVVTGEDPAVRIMRKVIENKKKWKDALRSYEFDAFTRQVIRRDTAIASITESYTTGYWIPGDTLHEVVQQKRQTQNVPVDENFAAVSRILNFYDDDVRFAGYTFIGPTALDAFDHYVFKLVGTRLRDSVTIYEIRIIPRSRLTPLFSGTITVVDGSFALAGVEVVPNEAFILPFIKNMVLQYAQQFNLYENRFWMPADIRIEGFADVGITGFTFPRIGFQRTSVIYDYRINTEIPDSVFAKPRRWTSSAADTVDSLFWAEHEILPLTLLETHAYATLDSAQTLEKQFQAGGPLSFLTSDESSSFFNHLRLRFNRVEGLHLGVRLRVGSPARFARLHGSWGYGFADERGKYRIGIETFPFRSQLLSVGFERYREVANRPDASYYDALTISLQSLLVKDDYRDYYLRKGWMASITGHPIKSLLVSGQYTSESHHSMTTATDFSLFARGSTYRANPPVLEGELHSLRFSVRYGDEPVPLQLLSRRAIEIDLEQSDDSWFNSDFNFTRFSARVEWKVETLFRRYLFPATLRFSVAAGTSRGTLPPQRSFDLETRSSGEAPFGVLRGASAKEFSGDRSLTVAIEHNFRSVPFLALGVPFLYKNSVELVIHGAIAQTWVEDFKARQRDILKPTKGWYSEAGFGINRIFGILRMDLTWRLRDPQNLFITGSAAVLY